MKLYTESQVKRMMQLARETNASEGQLFLSFEPIELPSDEEIEEGLFHQSNEYAYGYKDAFKWMRDKIQGGNQ